MHIKKCPFNTPEYNRDNLAAFCVSTHIMVAWNMILLVLRTNKFNFSHINLPTNLVQNPGEGMC